MNVDLHSKAHYSIAAVSKLSGVSCHTLRVWERRYGFPVPQRLASGHRRYPADQVDLICQVARRCQGGGSIASHIAEARAGQPEPRAEAPESSPGAFDAPIRDLLDHLSRSETQAAEAIYQRLTSGLPVEDIANEILAPAITEAGERLFRRDCALVEERLASMFFLRKLAALVDDAQRANPTPLGRVLVFVMQGDRHEGGALMLSLALELAGWRALFLGADLPILDVQRAIDLWSPAAVGVSLSLSRNIRKRFDELRTLRGAPIFVGGRSILNYQGLARRYGFGVVLWPAIPHAGRHLESLLRSELPPGQPPGPDLDACSDCDATGPARNPGPLPSWRPSASNRYAAERE